MPELTITLPYAIPTLNVLIRTHYRRRATQKLRMGREILAQLGSSRPAQPFERAHVVIERHSTGTPDPDGAVGACKDLLDCLTTPSVQANGKVRNKYGMGLIRDDSPKHITLEVRPVRCKRGEERTVVRLTSSLP